MHIAKSLAKSKSLDTQPGKSLDLEGCDLLIVV